MSFFFQAVANTNSCALGAFILFFLSFFPSFFTAGEHASTQVPRLYNNGYKAGGV